MRSAGFGAQRVVVAALGCLAWAGTAHAQGDGPHNLPLLPTGINILVAMPMDLSGNFNPQMTILVPGAEIDVFAAPLTYIRTFALGKRFGRLFLTAPLATLEAGGIVADPRGGTLEVTRGRSGIMDPMVTMHFGLIGAPALPGPEFVKHPRSFQMVAIVGAAIPIGTYDSDRLINLGTNRWAFRLGVGTVVPLGKKTAWESANTVFLFTDNDEPFRAGERSQDPLYVSENHLTHVFHPKWWGSVDLRYQYGGATETDGVADDNLTDILGGGLTLGHQVTQRLGGYLSYGEVLAKKGDAEERMIRLQVAYSF